MKESVLQILTARLQRELDKDDKQAYLDYCEYYGESSDDPKIIDGFITECYHWTDGNPENDYKYEFEYRTGDEPPLTLELNTPDNLPFVHLTVKDGYYSWSWGGATVSKPTPQLINNLRKGI